MSFNFSWIKVYLFTWALSAVGLFLWHGFFANDFALFITELVPSVHSVIIPAVFFFLLSFMKLVKIFSFSSFVLRLQTWSGTK
jgi:hypothetical protein